MIPPVMILAHLENGCQHQIRDRPLFLSAGHKKFSHLDGGAPESLSLFSPPCLQYRTRLSPVRMYESRFKNKEGNSAENQWKTAFLKELRAESVLS